MARGVDTGPHPKRQVAPETWKGTGIWQVHQPGLGKLDTVASDADEEGGHGMTSWHEARGYTAQVETLTPSSGGMDRATYQAGPFRTSFRSQVAAAALSNRVVTKRGADEYHQGTSFEPYERSSTRRSHS